MPEASLGEAGLVWLSNITFGKWNENSACIFFFWLVCQSVQSPLHTDNGWTPFKRQRLHDAGVHLLWKITVGRICNPLRFLVFSRQVLRPNMLPK